MWICGAILMGFSGVMLHSIGFGAFTWQYWAIVVPLIVGSMLMENAK